MNRILAPGARWGSVEAPASKSQAHRALICAALGWGKTAILCRETSRDIEATAACLSALGAGIRRVGDLMEAAPISAPPQGLRHLHCGESGSTLRFLLPVAGALGAEAVFHREGRLSQRPLHPLDQVLARRGMTLRAAGEDLFVSGRLEPGTFSLPGNVSSQYLSGLLMALPLLPGPSRLEVEGALESAGYVAMTEEMLKIGGVSLEREPGGWTVPGRQCYHLPEKLAIEGDWSNAAFFLCMGAMTRRGVTVRGLSLASRQGDREVLDILRAMGAEVCVEPGGVTVRRGEALRGVEIDAGPIPDLIPALCVTAAAAEGESRVVNAGRLRLKESDRIAAAADLISSLGGEVETGEAEIRIRGTGGLAGGTVSSWGDHRIAMSAALAACACRREVTVQESQCVDKSYPAFWAVFDALRKEEP